MWTPRSQGQNRVRRPKGIVILLTAHLLAAMIVLPVFGATKEKSEVAVPFMEREIHTLRDLNSAFIDIAATVKPTVVTVSTERVLSARQFNPFSPFSNDPLQEFFFGPRRQPQEQEYRQQGLGSGIIVSPEGMILTNNHVIEGADTIFVRTYDGRRYSATVVGRDPQTDVAVIRIPGDSLPAIEIGNSDELQVGEMVLAIGSPMTEELAYSVTQGIVSAKGRSNVGLTDYEDFIQTDAAINPGNSGGPLVNLEGKLVGINSAIASRSGGFQGIGFAVPVNMAMRVMNSLIAEGKVVRGWLGVSVQSIDEQIARAMNLETSSGALIGDVMEDSPADEAGLQTGDIVVAIDNVPVNSSSALRSRIASMSPGTSVTLAVRRDGNGMHIPVTLGELPSDLASGPQGGAVDLLGFSVEGLDRQLADQYGIDGRVPGLVVTQIDENSDAYQAGLREGDLITSVNRRRVGDPGEFSAAIGQLSEGDTVLLRILRRGSGYFLAFTISGN